jgi:hypothetical protein
VHPLVNRYTHTHCDRVTADASGGLDLGRRPVRADHHRKRLYDWRARQLPRPLPRPAQALFCVCRNPTTSRASCCTSNLERSDFRRSNRVTSSLPSHLSQPRQRFPALSRSKGGLQTTCITCGFMTESSTADRNPAVHLRTLPDIDDEDEGDVCRICRMVAEQDNPLFFPCKCSGSIRYVHEQCLKEWLNHSGNTHCEVSVPACRPNSAGHPTQI